MRIADNFFNLLSEDIHKTYFKDVAFYRDDAKLTRAKYHIELFNNGCLTYDKLVKILCECCNETKKNITTIINKYMVKDLTKKQKEAILKRLVFQMLKESTKHINSNFGKLIKSGAVNITEWDTNVAKMILPKTILVALFEAEAQQYSGKRTLYETKIKKNAEIYKNHL